jgi:hypothetical protein
MENNVFDETKLQVMIEFPTPDGSAQRQLKPLKLIRFFRELEILWSSKTDIIVAGVKKVESEIESETKALKREWEEKRDTLETRIDEINSMGEVAKESLSISNPNYFDDLLDSMDEIESEIANIDSSMVKKRIEKYALFIVTTAPDFLADILKLMFQDDGFSAEMIDGLSIPRMKFIFGKFKEINDIDFLLNNPTLKKLIKTVQQPAFGQ